MAAMACLDWPFARSNLDLFSFFLLHYVDDSLLDPLVGDSDNFMVCLRRLVSLQSSVLKALVDHRELTQGCQKVYDS